MDRNTMFESSNEYTRFHLHFFTGKSKDSDALANLQVVEDMSMETLSVVS